MHNPISEVEIQMAYYKAAAADYDSMHSAETPHLALALLTGAIEVLSAQSLLDVGSGTGRVLRHIRAKHPDVALLGVEPVAELRAAGYSHGLGTELLVEGDATRLQYGNQSFDIVCAFNVLHHIRRPRAAVDEMLRVTRKAIFVCDANNFGQGTFATRVLKQAIDLVHLWPFVNWIKTRGKGYTLTEGDGLAYSYSLFNDYHHICAHCTSVHLLSLSGKSSNLYRTAESLALLGVI